MAQTTPKGLRLHIGLFGRRNVGKSSLLNAIVRQEVSIVSKHAGTTTDPVEKPMELLPLGPVVFIDTAGIDDEGALGQLRIRKTQKTLDRADLGIIITDGTWDTFEQTLLDELQTRDVPIITVFNKIDINKPSAEVVQKLKDQKLVVIHTAVSNNIGIPDFRQALLNLAPEDFIDSPAIVGDIVGPGQTAVLVVPIDKEAPRGRLILPQVQSIRDLLDTDAM
jgi:[FeFe] hydrogenase H-cluster maturation GTPase HydF